MRLEAGVFHPEDRSARAILTHAALDVFPVELRETLRTWSGWSPTRPKA